VFPKFFTNRPVLASVLFIVIVLAVGVAVTCALVVRHYLSMPPTVIEVSTVYPGASARVVADKVGVPIEREVYGVEGMTSMTPHCTDDGAYRLTITFRRGTDPKLAQVLVQNRVALAERMLPEPVKQTGLSVTRPTSN
jgi:multidrug efflux pump